MPIMRIATYTINNLLNSSTPNPNKGKSLFDSRHRTIPVDISLKLICKLGSIAIVKTFTSNTNQPALKSI